jgi:DNA-directed RNA polymerase subunit RPC12/RpoP
MAEIKPGERFRCTDCGTEIVVIKSDGPVPHCCGKEMESVSGATG